MVSPGTSSPAERIAQAFNVLVASAQDLKDASGELAKPIASLEKALKRLTLGVACWTRMSTDSERSHFRIHDVGYAYSRSQGRWCLAIRTIVGPEGDPLAEYEETWPFGEAPRYLQIKAVDKLPELIEGLVKVTDATTTKLRKQVEPAQRLATAVNELIKPKNERV